MDSIEIFSDFIHLGHLSREVSFRFFNWNIFYISNRVKTIYNGDRLKNFVEESRLKAYSVGTMRYSNIDLQLKLLIPRSKVEDCKIFFQEMIENSCHIEDKKSRGVFVVMDDFRHQVFCNQFSFRGCFFFAYAAGLDGLGHEATKESIERWNQLFLELDSPSNFLDISSNFRVEESNKIPWVCTTDALKFFERELNLKKNLDIQTFPIFNFESTGFSLKTKRRNVFTKLTMYYPMAKAVEKKFMNSDSNVKIINFLDDEKQHAKYLKHRKKFEKIRHSKLQFYCEKKLTQNGCPNLTSP